jgi:hypothetical protein
MKCPTVFCLLAAVQLSGNIVLNTMDTAALHCVIKGFADFVVVSVEDATGWAVTIHSCT